MEKYGIGQALRRREDDRFLTGQGGYTDDVAAAGQAYGFVLRSPHAHADILAIDTAAAASAPGVLAVLTAADVAADRLGTLPCLADVPNWDGAPMATPPRPLLAAGRVRHVGEPVAFVIAESLARAKDAAELIAVEYAPLAVVTDTRTAAQAGQPQIWDEAPGNVCTEYRLGDAVATDAAFARAARVVSLDLVNNRVIVASMEPRNAIGDFDAATGRYTLTSGTQGVHRPRDAIADHVLKVPTEMLRVITPDVGGGFGMKAFLYAEQALVLWAARRVGRPVRWIGERSESFVSDSQARDHASYAELALDADHRILGLRVATTVNLGAYLSPHGAFISTILSATMLSGVYDIGAASAAYTAVFTNTVPTDAYRGAGRPEAAYVIERLIETAAREIGIAPDDIRRRNFIAPAAMPYATALGLVYDNGDFARNMDDAMARVDWPAFEKRRAGAAARGRLCGLGMATYIERCGGGAAEEATIRLDPGGTVTVAVGSQSTGQGHETAFVQLVAERLGLPFDDIRLVQGDTDAVVWGEGTVASRSLAHAGSAIGGAADIVIDKAAGLAADRLEVSARDLTFADGRFTVAGTDRAIGLAEVAASAEAGIEARFRFHAEAQTFPNGCHIAEVEIDRETGVLAIVAYTAVDDFGLVVNPLIVDGQLHGALAQGLGQAVFERSVYDPGSGQLLTGSLMDYCLPRADDLPAFDWARNVTPCTANPLGTKGCGEAGCIGGPPAIVNAVIDALAPVGVRSVDMPLTSEYLWRVIRAAGQ